jgi:hypothetical protein
MFSRYYGSDYNISLYHDHIIIPIMCYFGIYEPWSIEQHRITWILNNVI